MANYPGEPHHQEHQQHTIRDKITETTQKDRNNVEYVLHLRNNVDYVLHLRNNVDHVLHLRNNVDHVLHLRNNVDYVLHLTIGSFWCGKDGDGWKNDHLVITHGVCLS